MVRIMILTFAFLQSIAAAQIFPQDLNFSNSVLTIGVHIPPECGLVDSGSRSTDDVDALEIVMDNTKAYDIGTGFIYKYKDEKYVITCQHVLFKADSIVGYDSNYKSYDLELIGEDIFYDLAVLRFRCADDTENFEAVELNYIAQENDEVWAVGYWKWDGTPSTKSGKILNSDLQSDKVELLLEKIGFVKSDTRTEGGYSGGLLHDRNGKVIGMNNSVHIENKTSYALQSKILEKIANTIIEKGSVSRTYCGLQLSENIDGGGVRIDHVIQESPAAAYQEKLKNQTLERINEKSVNGIYDVLMAMENIAPNSNITLGLSSGNIVLKTSVLNEQHLKDIAKHAICKNDYDEYIDIKEEGDRITLIDNEGESVIALTAGIKYNLVYCLSSLEELGAIIRIFSLHKQIRIGYKDKSHNRTKKINLSENLDRRVLFY